MENKRHGSGSSSSSINFDHLFGLKDSSSSSSVSSTSELLGSIFPPPSTGGVRNPSESGMRNKNGESSKGNNKSSNIYQNNEVAEPSYLSSSIYYGGQENYSPRTRNTTDPSYHVVKKDGDDDPNGNNANNIASRGNWWQGSLYY